MTFPFLKVTKFPNDVLFFHRISLQQAVDFFTGGSVIMDNNTYNNVVQLQYI